MFFVRLLSKYCEVKNIMNNSVNEAVRIEDYKLCIICCHPFVLNNQLENVEKISEFCEEIKGDHDIERNDGVETKHVCEEILELEIRFGMSVCFNCLVKMTTVLTSKENLSLLEHHVLSLQKEILKEIRNLEKLTKQTQYHRDNLRKTVADSDELNLKRRLNTEKGAIESNSLAFKLRQWILKDMDSNKQKVQVNPLNSETDDDNSKQKEPSNQEKEIFDFVDLTLDSGDDESAEKRVDIENTKINSLNTSIKIIETENCDAGKTPATNLKTKSTKKLPETNEKIKMNSTPIQNKMTAQYLRRLRYCALCSFSTIQDPLFEQHLRKHENEDINSKPKYLECTHCPSKFSTQQYFQFHLNCHTGLLKMRCDLCFKRIPVLSLAPHLKSHFPPDEMKVAKIIYCQNCSFCCASRKTYLTHLTRHKSKTCTGIFNCDICSEEFIKPPLLLKHYHDKHEETRENLPCDFPNCDRVLTSRSSLADHKYAHLRRHKKAPTNLKYTCDQCGRELKSKRILTDHLKIHSGEKNWKCVYCGREFFRRQHLKEHVRLHTGERPFVCEVCGMGFNKRQNLRIHRENKHST